MRNHIQAFERHLSARLSSRTVATYVAVLDAFTDFVAKPWPTRQDVEAFLGRVRRSGHTGAAATRNQELAALRAFVRFASRDLALTDDPTRGVAFRKEFSRDPAVLSVDELRAFFRAAAAHEAPFERAQMLAILALMSQAGLRVHELVATDVLQLDLASATLISVKGKGGTLHDVPLNAPTLSLLVAWIASRAKAASPDEPALFVTRRGGRVSVRAVQRLVASLRSATGTAKRVTPHTFRHTTATLALTLGADLSTVADLLRHTDLNTTRRYLHLVDERRREAVRRLGAAIPAELISKAEMDRSGAEVRDGSGRATHENQLDVQYRLGGDRKAA